MSLSDAEILRQNRWWSEPGWEAADPHLRELRRQPRRLPAPPLDEIALDAPAIHTLRGPRQVGKSTALKLLAKRAIERWDPDQVIYLALDLLEDRPLSELAATISRAKELAAPRGRVLLLLDEITMASGWQTAIKALWDDGSLREDVVVCTASILQQCLKAGLVDEIHVDVAPLLLGAGVRLFGDLGAAPISLECTRVVGAPGVTHMRYHVVKV